jgi:hypothetical protein
LFIILNCILYNIKQHQLIFHPILIYLNLLKTSTFYDENFNAISLNLLSERFYNFNDMLDWMLISGSYFFFKFIFLYFHTEDLVLLIKPQHLPLMLYSFHDQLEIIYLLQKLLIFLFFAQLQIILLYQLYNLPLSNLTPIDYKVQRSHLFMTIILRNGCLVHIVT